jgi:hypothetical protein
VNMGLALLLGLQTWHPALEVTIVTVQGAVKSRTPQTHQGRLYAWYQTWSVAPKVCHWDFSVSRGFV